MKLLLKLFLISFIFSLFLRLGCTGCPCFQFHLKVFVNSCSRNFNTDTQCRRHYHASANSCEQEGVLGKCL